MSPAVAAPAAVLERLRLDNGLRVVLAPDREATAVCVAVHYDVGFRSEPAGRGGFAHLFEHLMFEGSERIGPGEHTRLVQAAGGTFNGTTYRDHTAYYQIVPPEALERTLFLEADRMRGPRLTEATLARQLAVVKEEILRNITAQPYGGFPWVPLPPALFTTFANTHNGYGDLADLEASTLADCAAFFDTHYAPGNAVLTVCGDFDPQAGADLVRRHFADVPARPVPVPAALAEPRPTGDRQDEHAVPGLPMAALALGLRLPDPVGDTDRYLAAAAVGALLGDGENAVLHRRAVRETGSAVGVHAGAGLTGVPLEARDPDVFVIRAMLTSPGAAATVTEIADRALRDLAEHGPDPAALARTTARAAVERHRRLDRLGSRAQQYGRFELHHGDAALAAELPDRIRRTTPEQVAAAAADLAGQRRRSVLLVPAPTPGAPR
ncbi:M16 family metallopeptidase [Kitasatospora sp. NPDC088391]|uniref:M16 family metallopeptidase n=1 Tax=Kitasatospora sp. NPDC088391 TaxID=3364074 RepID=UPI00380858DE